MIGALVLAALPPFVSKVTENFLDRRRDSVAVTELQHQVTHLLMSQHLLERDLGDASLTVLSLSRYLALKEDRVFLLRDNLLRLVAPLNENRPLIVSRAIDEFSSSVEARIGHRIASAGTKRQMPTAVPLVGRQHGAPGIAMAAGTSALNDFFEGFDDEIMQARLGYEE